MASSSKKEEIFRIMLMGDVGTGKTTFLTHLIHRTAQRVPKPTTNLSLFTMRISKPPAVVQVWDSPGDPKYYYQTLGLISKFDSVLLFVDVTNQYTYDRARLISDQLAAFGKMDKLCVHLVQSKIQAAEKDPIKRKVSSKMLWSIAQRFGGGVFEYRQDHNLETMIEQVVEWKSKGHELQQKQKHRDQQRVEFQQAKFEKQAENLNCECVIF